MMRSNTICDWAKSQNILHHTMCLDEADSLCKQNNWDHESRIFDTDDKKLVVDLHNEKRQKVVTANHIPVNLITCCQNIMCAQKNIVSKLLRFI